MNSKLTKVAQDYKKTLKKANTPTHKQVAQKVLDMIGEHLGDDYSDDPTILEGIQNWVGPTGYDDKGNPLYDYAKILEDLMEEGLDPRRHCSSLNLE